MKNYLKVLLLFLLAVLVIPIFGQDVPVEPVDPEPAFNIWVIISGVLAVLTSIFGATVAKFRKKLKQIVSMIKEGVEVIVVLTEALDDNNVNPDEIAALKKAVAEFKAAWKLIWNKV